MKLNGHWPQTRDAMRARWTRLSPEDLASISGERLALVQVLKERYGKTYGEIEREVTEFDMREIWAANMARPSRGITND